jgi:hypothetical protein
VQPEVQPGINGLKLRDRAEERFENRKHRLGNCSYVGDIEPAFFFAYMALAAAVCYLMVRWIAADWNDSHGDSGVEQTALAQTPERAVRHRGDSVRHRGEARLEPLG